jgi:hypothetical protein
MLESYHPANNILGPRQTAFLESILTRSPASETTPDTQYFDRVMNSLGVTLSNEDTAELREAARRQIDLSDASVEVVVDRLTDQRVQRIYSDPNLTPSQQQDLEDEAYDFQDNATNEELKDFALSATGGTAEHKNAAAHAAHAETTLQPLEENAAYHRKKIKHTQHHTAHQDQLNAAAEKRRRHRLKPEASTAEKTIGNSIYEESATALSGLQLEINRLRHEIKEKEQDAILRPVIIKLLVDSGLMERAAFDRQTTNPGEYRTYSQLTKLRVPVDNTGKPYRFHFWDSTMGYRKDKPPKKI